MSVIGRFHAADGMLYRLLHGRMRTRQLDSFMVAASDIGTKSAAWLTVAAVLSIFGGRRARQTAVITTMATLLAQGVVNLLLKPMVRRRRPFFRKKLQARLLVAPPHEHSWPSGHAASSAAAVTTLVCAYPGSAAPLLLLGLAIAYSRVYVGVHYPFDVLAGTVVGAAAGTGCVVLSRSVSTRNPQPGLERDTP